MKEKLVSYLILIICTFIFGGIQTGDAAENSEFVDPNVYEEKEITIYKHYDKTDDITRELHEDLRELTFERQRMSEKDRLVNDLFVTTTSEKNTILAKASKLNLFSGEYTAVEKSDDIDVNGTFSRLNILLMTIFIVTIIMLLVLVPKLNRTEQGSK